MTVINAVKEVKKFLEERVCPNIELLVPSTNDGKEYVENYANPKVFAFFEPSNSRLPKGATYTTPNIIVQFTQGTENLASNKKSLEIILVFSAWRPGEYSALNDMELEGIDITPQGANISFNGEIAKQFERSEDGWQDVYSLMELTKEQIVKVGKIGNYILDLNEIKYGQFTKDGALIDFYPYYHIWMSFSLTTIPTPAIREELDDFL